MCAIVYTMSNYVAWSYQSNYAPSVHSACFPSIARVNLENGKVVTMSELKTGDRVQTGINYNKENIGKTPKVIVYLSIVSI